MIFTIPITYKSLLSHAKAAKPITPRVRKLAEVLPVLKRGK